MKLLACTCKLQKHLLPYLFWNIPYSCYNRAHLLASYFQIGIMQVTKQLEPIIVEDLALCMQCDHPIVMVFLHEIQTLEQISVLGFHIVHQSEKPFQNKKGPVLALLRHFEKSEGIPYPILQHELKLITVQFPPFQPLLGHHESNKPLIPESDLFHMYLAHSISHLCEYLEQNEQRVHPLLLPDGPLREYIFVYDSCSLFSKSVPFIQFRNSIAQCVEVVLELLVVHLFSSHV